MNGKPPTLGDEIRRARTAGVLFVLALVLTGVQFVFDLSLWPMMVLLIVLFGVVMAWHVGRERAGRL